MTQRSLQTQCPQCETHFRVSDKQLGVANGKVRCGNCMKVFNALEQQVADFGPAVHEPEPQPEEGFGADEILFADNPEEDAAEGRYAGSKLTFSDDELSDSFREAEEPAPPGFRDDDDRSDEQVDESWAEAMLENIDASGQTEDHPEPEPEPRPTLPPVAPPEPEADLSAEPERDEQPLTATGNRADHAPTDTTGQAFRPDNLYRDLRRDPVSVAGNGSGWRTAFWSLLVLALTGILIAQVTWFQFDRLSAIPQLRPWYEKGCELAGCELTPLIDVSAIQSRKLVVRTDPDNRAQLIVDAVVLNRAGFEQPFPAIALTFSNLNGDVVAQSVFMPGEYLTGEADIPEAMPVDTPVRIKISIRDPGRDAVNYNLGFRPAAP